MTSKIRKISLGLVAMLFFTLPFERIPTLDFHGYTIKISYIIALVLLTVQLVNFLVGKVDKVNYSKSDICLFIFWFLTTISLSYTPGLKRGLIVWMMWTFMFVLYYTLTLLLRNKTYQKVVQKWLMAAVILTSLFGLYQFFGDSFGLSIAWTGLKPMYTKSVFGFPRIQSVGLEPLYFGNFLLVPLFLVAAYYIRERKLWGRQWFLLLILLVVLILGIARSIYISVGFSMLLFVVTLLLNKNDIFAKKAVAGIALAGILAAVISLGMVRLANGHKATENFVGHASVDDTKVGDSVPGRIHFFKLAFEQFKERPILGYGIASFGVLNSTDSSSSQSGYNVVNNEYLEIMAELGLLGLFAFLSFLIFSLIEAINAYKVAPDPDKVIILALIIGLVAVFTQYNFFSTLYVIHIWSFLALLKAKAASVLD